MSKKTNEMLVRDGVAVLRGAGALAAADTVQRLLDGSWRKRDARQEERGASQVLTRRERRLAGRAVRVTRRALARAGLGAHDVLVPRADVHQPLVPEKPMHSCRNCAMRGKQCQSCAKMDEGPAAHAAWLVSLRTPPPAPASGMTIYIWNEMARIPASVYAAANYPAAKIVVSTDQGITTDLARGVMRYGF